MRGERMVSRDYDEGELEDTDFATRTSSWPSSSTGDELET
jgi:hypothetical protein